ncbi:MAG: hypothetical protein CVV02_10485 [Firmicutes bacterium HGW-Firmicutes-7]|nr:MAG: hypothetical protein CVV02_10485 [Firmicutes bacterium HGW-Firmicutes-7]
MLYKNIQKGEVIKRAGLNVKFIPLINLGLGVCAAFLIYSDIKQAIIVGLMVGLSASGLYSGVKNVIEGEGVKGY